jgi:hypothetical protein
VLESGRVLDESGHEESRLGEGSPAVLESGRVLGESGHVESRLGEGSGRVLDESGHEESRLGEGSPAVLESGRVLGGEESRFDEREYVRSRSRSRLAPIPVPLAPIPLRPPWKLVPAISPVRARAKTSSWPPFLVSRAGSQRAPALSKKEATSYLEPTPCNTTVTHKLSRYIGTFIEGRRMKLAFVLIAIYFNQA